MIFNRVRLHDARVIHDARQKRGLGSCRHDDAPAFGLNQLPILGKVIQRALIHLQVDQLPAAECESLGTPRSQSYRTELGADEALIGDLIADQGDIAALGGPDGSLIDHAPCARTAKGSAARFQCAVLRIEGRCRKTADVDLRATTKDDAIRIDQPDLPIGVKMPEYRAGGRAQDPVDRDRIRIRLNKINNLVRGDIKALPVQR